MGNEKGERGGGGGMGLQGLLKSLQLDDMSVASIQLTAGKEGLEVALMC